MKQRVTTEREWPLPVVPWQKWKTWLMLPTTDLQEGGNQDQETQQGPNGVRVTVPNYQAPLIVVLLQTIFKVFS